MTRKGKERLWTVIFNSLAIILIALLGFGVLSIRLKNTIWVVSWSVVLGLTIAGWFYIGWPWFKRWLADNLWFWARVPEMRAVIILFEKALHKIIINCGDLEKRERIIAAIAYSWNLTPGQEPNQEEISARLEGFRQLLEVKDLRSIEKTFDSVENLVWLADGTVLTPPPVTIEYKDKGQDKKIPVSLVDLRPLIFLGSQQKVYWVGVPWKYQAYRWIEDSLLKEEEKERAEPEPHVSLNLRERVVDFDPPSMDTADRIQVKTLLVIFLEVVDIRKALFGVNHFTEAIKKLIEGEWRQVLAKLRYFEYDKKTGQISEVPKIHTLSQQRLQVQLGIGKAKKTEVKEGSTTEIGKSAEIREPKEPAVEVLKPFSNEWIEEIKDKPAGICFHNWGILLRGVEVRDIDPQEADEIRKAMRQHLEKQAAYLAAKEEAKADAARKKAVALAPLEGQAEGFEKLKEVLNVDGETIVNWEMLKKALEKANVTLIGQESFDQLLGLLQASRKIIGKGGK